MSRVRRSTSVVVRISEFLEAILPLLRGMAVESHCGRLFRRIALHASLLWVEMPLRARARSPFCVPF